MSDSPAQAIETPPPAFAARLSVSFIGAFLAIGIFLPYFPVWLKTLDLADWQVGILLSLPMFLRIVTTPLIAAYADRARDRADILFLMSVLALATTAGLYAVETFWALLIVILAQAVAAAPQVPLIDALTITGVRRYRIDYARVRLWGSLAFIVSNIIGGIAISRFGGGVVLHLLVAAFAAMVAISLLAPRLGWPRRPSPLGGTGPRGFVTGALAARPAFLLTLGGGALIHASHAMLYGFSAIYWDALGYSGTVIGLLWAASVAGEVILFQFAGRLLGHIAIERIVIGGGMLAALRWLVFPFDFGVWWYLALQLLHAGTFAAVHLALQRLIVSHAGEEREAATQGTLFFLSGVTMGTFTILSGYWFDLFGAPAFVAMALVAISGVFCHIAGQSRLR